METKPTLRGFAAIRKLLGKVAEPQPVAKAEKGSRRNIDEDLEQYDLLAQNPEDEDQDEDEDLEEQDEDEEQDGMEGGRPIAKAMLEDEEFLDATPIIKAFHADLQKLLTLAEALNGRVAALEGLAQVPEQNVLMAKAHMGTTDVLRSIAKSVRGLESRLDSLEQTLDTTPRPARSHRPPAEASPGPEKFDPRGFIIKAASLGVSSGTFTSKDVARLESAINAGDLESLPRFLSPEQLAFLSADERSAN